MCAYRLVFSDHFDSLYIPEPNSGCWLWLGFVDAKGYAKMYTAHFPDQKRAHRISYIVHKGKIPDGLLVCHKCDVRCCVNPEHLFLGTHADNLADMVNKGRNKKRRKLAPSEIMEIRSAYAGGASIRELARKTGLWRNNVSQIINRVTYKNIT